MQSPEEKERSAAITYLIGKTIFVLFMLIALVGMHQAWADTHGWSRRYELVAPWFFLGIVGVGIWLSTARNQIERQFAGIALMLIGFGVQYAYEALGALASTHL